MEVDTENPQFDSFLGGTEAVPSGLNLSEFIKHRMEEVVMLSEALEESPFRGQAFQRLPKHMRRRQMSHYIKRLPRRLQRPYLLSLKDGPPTPTKRPSRKYRRRPSNLLLEYNRRQKTAVWLETHIWHAKRFHMTTKWGYKLPKKPVNKSFKACYLAILEHCLLLDMSYYNCIELMGPECELLENLKLCTSVECGLTFGAKMYLSGTREGSVTLFHPNSYPYRAIGNVSFMWQPVTCGGSCRKIWIWVHPLIHNEVVECFKLLFDFSIVPSESVEADVIVEKEIYNSERGINGKMKTGGKSKEKKMEEIKLETKNIPFNRTPKFANKNKSVTMILLKDTLNRFRLTGPLSQALVSQAFTVASVRTDCSEEEIAPVESKRRKTDLMKEVKDEKREGRLNWWKEYYKNENFKRDWYCQKNFLLSDWSNPNDLPSGMILGLVIEDPRMRIPSKREKAVARVKENVNQVPETSLEPSRSQSPIWIPQIRDEVSTTKLTTQQLNEARSKKIVPGFDLRSVIPDDMQSRIPILLVQKSGNRDPITGKLGFGSGWDIIVPANFGMPVWLSLIFRGARTGGLKETELLRLESNSLNEYLPPDSAAGESENLRKQENLKTRYFKLPPNKRANFMKLGVVSPFYPPWRILVRDWILSTEPGDLEVEKVKFSVLRNSKTLRELNDLLNEFTKQNVDRSVLQNAGREFLVPVVIECTGKGKPNDLALICIPEDEDLRKSSSGPSEPSHVDDNEKCRKILKSNHSKLLKYLKRKRQKERGKLKEKFASNFHGELNWKEILKSGTDSSEVHSLEYKNKMESLWLPDRKSIIDSCSRKISGFIVKGGFSYSRSRGLGLGYITVPGLIALLRIWERNRSKAVVLVRNRNQVQYRFASLRIAI